MKTEEQKVEAIAKLKEMVDGLEATPAKDFAFQSCYLAHRYDVTDPAYGEIVVDAKLYGQSFIMSTLPLDSDKIKRIRKILEGGTK